MFRHPTDHGSKFSSERFTTAESAVDPVHQFRGLRDLAFLSRASKLLDQADPDATRLFRSDLDFFCVPRPKPSPPISPPFSTRLMAKAFETS